MRYESQTRRFQRYLAYLGCAFVLASTTARAADTWVIKDVTVIPLDTEETLEHQSVTIANGVIKKIEPADASAAIAAEANTIDGRGRFLIPGLVDAHAHFRTVGYVIDSEDGLKGLKSEAGTPYPYDRRVLFSFLKSGITTIFHLGGGGDEVLRIRDLIASGEIPGPRIVVGKLINGPPQAFSKEPGKVVPPSSIDSPLTAADGRAAVLAAKAKGYDFIKAYQFLTEETYDAVIRTAHEQGLIVIGHLPQLGCTRCAKRTHPFDLPLDVIAHTEELGRYGAQSDLDPTDLSVLTDLTLRSGSAVIPTLFSARTITYMYLNREVPLPPQKVLRYLDPATLWWWQPERVRYLSDDFRNQPTIGNYPAANDFGRVLTRQLWKKGVPLLVGTDSSFPGVAYGFSYGPELLEMRAIGLSPRQVLQAATQNPHRLIGEAGRAGAVRAGQRADLLLLEANPLQDLTNLDKLAGIVVAGRWFSSAEIDRVMEDSARYFQKLDRRIGISIDRAKH